MTAPTLETQCDQGLVGQVALVTGGAGGLGTAICRTLAMSGVIVIAGDVDDDQGHALANEAAAQGISITYEHLDVADRRSAESVVDDIVRRHERLDVLVNNAGIDRTLPIGELDPDDFDRVLAVNLRGPFILARRALAEMASSGRGHIVNVASTAAKRAWPNAAAYHASKWGLLGLSHALHAEARSYGVKVTAVVAGGMRTPFLLDRFPDLDITTLQEPTHVAEAIRFVLTQPPETVIPEIMVLPMGETSWP